MRVEEGQLRDFLIDAGLVSRSQLDATLRHTGGKPLSQALIEEGVLSEEEVRRASAHALGIPYVVLERDDIDPIALLLIPEPVCRTHSVVAYRAHERTVEVALLDMADLPAIEFLEEKTKVLPRLTNRESLRRALLIYQKNLKEKFGAALEGVRNTGETLLTLLSHAMNQNAGTIYLEPGEGDVRVRYRVRGALHEAYTLSKKSGEKITSYLKESGSFDTHTSSSQEARFKIEVGGQSVLVRVGFTPTTSGENITLNLAPEYLGKKGFTLESLGFHGKALEEIYKIFQQKKGLVVIAGPQNSGTTTTLYTLLDLLNRPELLLASIEREVGYRLPHVAQTEVREDLGLSAASALRGVLRQDPDVVFVGDVADQATALLALQAAKQRLVLLEVRADSALAAVEKLLSLGVPQDLLSNTLSVAVGQRLVRRLCKNDREEHYISRAESESFEEKADFGAVLGALKEERVVPKGVSWKDVPFFRAAACGECKNGHLSANTSRGRIGLFEVFGPDMELAGLTLLENGLFKAAQGLTSIEEVLLKGD